MACVYDMILTDGLTDRLVDGLADGRITLVGLCNQSCICIGRGNLSNVNDAKLKYSEEIWLGLIKKTCADD